MRLKVMDLEILYSQVPCAVSYSSALLRAFATHLHLLFLERINVAFPP